MYQVYATQHYHIELMKKGHSVSYNDLTFPEPDELLFTWGLPW